MIRVLVVDDEPIVAQAHADLVAQLPDFTVVAQALSAQEAARTLRSERVDLVLLDINLPDLHGLDLLRRLRAGGVPVDVIAVTAARDVELVRGAVSAGIVGYLIKPFAPASLRERLLAYRDFRAQVDADELDQDQVDAMLSTLRPAPSEPTLPKGLSRETLHQVESVLRDRGAASAGEVAQEIGASRVTARRYLEHLVESASLERTTRLGRTGRPEVEYRPRT